MDNWDVAVEFGFDDAFAASKNFYNDACVYVLAMSNGSTKIGMSQQFLSRIIQIEHDTGLEVVNACHSRYMPNQAARALEARLHNYFKEYICWRREYFNITFDEGVQKLCEALCSSDALKNPASSKVDLFTEFKNFIGNRLRYVVGLYSVSWYIYNILDNGTWFCQLSSLFGTTCFAYNIDQKFREYLESKGVQSSRVRNNDFFKKTLRKYLERIKSSPEYRIHTSDFNSQPYLLNCKNGVVDLRTGTLLPHNPALLLTLNTNVEYRGLNYHSEEVDRFLKYIMPDDETRKAVLRFLGYALTGYNTEHVAMLASYSFSLYALIKRTFGYYLLGWDRGVYDSNDVFEKLKKGWVDRRDSFVQSRLFQSEYETRILTPTINLFTDEYKNIKDFFVGEVRRPSCKLLTFENNLRLENIDDAKRFLQVELNYSYSGSHIQYNDKDIQSGFLSVLVQAAMDWFQASEGGTKKGLIESPQMKAYKKSYLQKHGVNLSKRNFEKWLYDTN